MVVVVPAQVTPGSVVLTSEQSTLITESFTWFLSVIGTLLDFWHEHISRFKIN